MGGLTFWDIPVFELPVWAIKAFVYGILVWAILFGIGSLVALKWYIHQAWQDQEQD